MPVRERIIDNLIKPKDTEIVSRFRNRGVHTVISVPCSITATMDSQWQVMAETEKQRVQDGDPEAFKLIKTTHEGNLVGIAAGMYMGSGRIPLIHMQNSGFTNSADGLISFAKVYKLPTLELVTWRGSNEADDSEPHQEIGKMTDGLTKTVIGSEGLYGTRFPQGRGILRSIEKAIKKSNEGGIGVIRLAPDAFKKEYPMILPSTERGSLEDYEATLEEIAALHGRPMREVYTDNPISRAEAMQEITRIHPDAAIVYANGYNARQGQADADRRGSFYNAGYMGGALAIGWGMAVSNSNIDVVVVDGDQNAQMSHMRDNLQAEYPKNLQWYILDNGIGASVGVSKSVNLKGYLPDPGYYRLARVIETVPDDPNQKFLPPRVGGHGVYFDRREARLLEQQMGGPLPAHAVMFRSWVQDQTERNISNRNNEVNRAVQSVVDRYLPQ